MNLRWRFLSSNCSFVGGEVPSPLPSADTALTSLHIISRFKSSRDTLAPRCGPRLSAAPSEARF